MKTHYLAITIGPVFDTIVQARKTRELWAASFFFSSLMREIICAVPKGEREKILLPAIDQEKYLDKSNYGAGVFPDRCIIGSVTPLAWSAEDIIQPAVAKLADLFGVAADRLHSFLRIRSFKAGFTADELLQSTTDGHLAASDRVDHLAIHRLNRLLANQELKINYRPVADEELVDLLIENIHKLYDLGHDPSDDEVFIKILGIAGRPDTVRVPSIPEIALREIAASAPEIYRSEVESPFSTKIEALRGGEARAKDVFSEVEEEKLYRLLSDKLKKENRNILLRHKYYAVVVADGDNVGKAVSRASKKGNVAIRELSLKLSGFSREAVKMIVAYGGLPVYAGGDDIFFIAPVANPKMDRENNSGAGHDVLELCQRIDAKFKSLMNTEDERGEDPIMSLSFGVSVNYYKFPLGEAVTNAYRMEGWAKNFVRYDEAGNKRKKNALALEVQKHSGQQYGTVISLDDEESIQAILQMNHPENEADEGMLTSFLHRLQSLETLLASAYRKKNHDHFLSHHFNEGGRHDADYLKNAFELGEKLFAGYQPEDTNDATSIAASDGDNTRRLFSLLRYKHFLLQADHD